MNGKSPDAFRTISEVAEWLGVNAHVLRFWESKFSQVKPVKRAGGRRYYRPSDMELLGGIQKLLHEDGMTIKGAQKILREQGVKAVSAMSKPVEFGAAPAPQAAEKAAEPEKPPAQEMPEAIEQEHAPSETAEARKDTQVNGSADAAPSTLPLFGHQPAPANDVPPPATARPTDTPTAAVREEPVIAPLPPTDETLAEAITRLVPLQIPPAKLAPIHAGLLALRERMDRAG